MLSQRAWAATQGAGHGTLGPQRCLCEAEGEGAVPIAVALGVELGTLARGLATAPGKELAITSNDHEVTVLGAVLLAYGDEISPLGYEAIHAVVFDADEAGRARPEPRADRRRDGVHEASFVPSGLGVADTSEVHGGEVFLAPPDGEGAGHRYAWRTGINDASGMRAKRPRTERDAPPTRIPSPARTTAFRPCDARARHLRPFPAARSTPRK